MENNLESGVLDGFLSLSLLRMCFFITFFPLRYSKDSNMARYHRSLEKRFCANISEGPKMPLTILYIFGRNQVSS